MVSRFNVCVFVGFAESDLFLSVFGFAEYITANFVSWALPNLLRVDKCCSASLNILLPLCCFGFALCFFGFAELRLCCRLCRVALITTSSSVSRAIVRHRTFPRVVQKRMCRLRRFSFQKKSSASPNIVSMHVLRLRLISCRQMLFVFAEYLAATLFLRLRTLFLRLRRTSFMCSASPSCPHHKLFSGVSGYTPAPAFPRVCRSASPNISLPTLFLRLRRTSFMLSAPPSCPHHNIFFGVSGYSPAPNLPESSTQTNVSASPI